MDIVFFTEAGSEYGYGHLMRCLALAEGFREKSLEVLFLVRGEGDYSSLFSDYSFKQVEWFNQNTIKSLLKENRIVLVDSYYVNENLCRYIYNNFDKVLFFDDIQRINYPGGYVLNGVIGAELMDYPSAPSLKYLLGAEFQSLRKEFWDVPEYQVREKIEHVMITFGGSDVTNETPEYMKRVRELFPRCIISVVIGKGFRSKNQIESVKDNKTDLYYYPDAKKMMNLMVQSDLAISAAGQTISELARVGTPTIGIQVVDNQKINIKNWRESGFLLNTEILNYNISHDIRQICSETGRKIIDGLGVKRIVEKLIC